MSILNIIKFSIKTASSFPSLGQSLINNYYEYILDLLTLIIPNLAPPPYSFLVTVQKSSMLPMFRLYVNSCYICVVAPKLWFGPKNWFWGICMLSKYPDFRNCDICEFKNCNFRVLKMFKMIKYLGNSLFLWFKHF